MPEERYSQNQNVLQMSSNQSRKALYAPVIFLIVAVTFSILVGCRGGRSNHAGLIEVNRLASVSPETAMAKLDSIDYGSLSERDRHYYDLLSVKVNDKAYVTHESDSLILDVNLLL